MDKIFKHGNKEVDSNILLKALQDPRNLSSYKVHKGWSQEQFDNFKEALSHISQLINNNQISSDGFGELTDNSGSIDKNNIYYGEAANYIIKIAGKAPEYKRLEIKDTRETFDSTKHGFDTWLYTRINPMGEDYNKVMGSYIALFPKGQRVSHFQSLLNEYNNTLDKYDFAEGSTYKEDINNLIGKGGFDEYLYHRLGIKQPYKDLFDDTEAPITPPKKEEKEGKEGKEEGNEELTNTSIHDELANVNIPAGVFSDVDEVSKHEISEISKNSYSGLRELFKNDEKANKAIDILEQQVNNTHPSKVKKLSKYIHENGFFSVPSSAYNYLYQTLVKDKKMKTKEAKDLLYKVGAFEEGGILKANGGIKMPTGYELYLELDANKKWRTKQGIDINAFRTWAALNNLKISNIPNYGNGYTYNADNYKTLYNEGATTNLTGLGSDYRQDSGLITKESQGNITDLNKYASEYRPYKNQTDNNKRKLDFSTAIANIAGETLEERIANYNKNIDKLYAFKKSENGANGGLNNQAVKDFNDLHNSLYSSSNSNNGVYGWDENLSSINGSTTLQRGPDITDNEVELTFAEGDNAYDILGNNTLVKTKSGHYYIKSNDYNVEEPAPVPVKIKGGDNNEQEGDNEGDNKGDNNLIVTPQTRGLINYGLVLDLFKYFKNKQHNRELYELTNLLTPLLKDPVEHHRNVYGNLRAIADANRRGAQRMNLAKSMFTSDNSQNIALLYDVFNKNTEDFLQALAQDDERMRQTSEASWQQEKENKNNRHLTAMENRASIWQVDREKLSALSGYKSSNHQSLVNLIDGLKKDWLIEKAKKEAEEKPYREYHEQLALASKVMSNPSQYVGATWTAADTEIWNKAQRGEELTAIERQQYLHLLEIIAKAIQAQLGLKYGVTYPEVTVNRPIFKRGGKLTEYLNYFNNSRK